MNERIWSVRVFNCASISGTVSGIGSGTSAGSMPDAAPAGLRSAGVAGGGAAGAVVAGAVVAGAALGAAGAALVMVGAAIVCGSFENAGKVKSNRFALAPGVNVTLAYISAGSGSLPIAACIVAPLRTSE